MNLRNCYAIKQKNDIRKILIEISPTKKSSLGSNFYEITVRKTSSGYKLIGIDIVKRPFEYFQELPIHNVKKIDISEQKLEKILIHIEHEFLNQEKNKKEFNYLRDDEFYKKNGININPGKQLINNNKRKR